MNHINMVMPNNVSSLDYEDARQTLDTLHEISNLLRCNIDRNTLSILVSLLEGGSKPEHLSAIVC